MTFEKLTWPPELDAVIAAPEHHQLLRDNESVRVLETKIEPGHMTKLHTHRWPAVYYLLSTGDIVRRDETRAVLFDSRLAQKRAETGQAVWSPPLAPHTLENFDHTPIRVISVEVKPPGTG